MASPTSFDQLDGCPYIPLGSYNWHTSTNYYPGCHRSLALNLTVYCIFAATHAVAIWSALALITVVVGTFRKRNTLYFWSLMVTCTGIILMTIGFDVPMFTNIKGSTNKGFLTILYVGWVLVVNGFSLTLWSRVHLILLHHRLHQCLLAILIIDAVIVQVPAIVVGYLPFTPAVFKALKVASKLEVIIYAQEIFLSSLYTFLFCRFIRERSSSFAVDKKARTTLYGLIIGQAVVLACDVTMVTLLFLNLYLARKLVLPLTYAIKILIEFFVLNQLMKFSCTNVGRLEVQDMTSDIKHESFHAAPERSDGSHSASIGSDVA